MVMYVENLKRTHEKEHSELEEARLNILSNDTDASVTLGTLPVSSLRWSGIALTPNFRDALLSLKTVVPDNLDHIKEKKG